MGYKYEFTYTGTMVLRREQELSKLKYGLPKNFFLVISLIFGICLGAFAVSVFFPALLKVYSSRYVFYVLLPIMLVIAGLPFIVNWVMNTALDLIKNSRGFKLPPNDETEWQVTMAFDSKSIIWESEQVTMMYFWSDIVKICSGATFDFFYSRHGTAPSLPMSCHDSEQDRRQFLAWCHKALG